MNGSRSDQQWKRLGDLEPYWAVLSVDEYRTENLTLEAKEKFFESGLRHVKFISETIKEKFATDFYPKSSIDFGCGTGRIVVNLAEFSEHIVGVDISEKMIIEAKSNCDERGISNVSFVMSTDNLDGLKGEFDFIHSFLCLQHINPKRGYTIMGNLLDRLNEGGIAVLHFPIRGAKGKNGRIRAFFRTSVPFAHNFYNLFTGSGFFSPYMETHHYDLGIIIGILEKREMKNYFLQGFVDRFGTIGLFLFVNNVD